MPLTQSDSGADNLFPATAERPAGIYVHIPFCQTKCPYCSFVSYPAADFRIKEGYIRALHLQLCEMARHPWTETRKFHSLFVGGGNPPSVGVEQLAAFIAACLKAFDFTAEPERSPEVTVEANPNTIDPEMLERFRAAGVNRLSIGIQAFSDIMLKNIGRSHTVADGIKAFEQARHAGFTNINLDLMYGLPGQDLADWQNSLHRAVVLAPEHLSVYELTVEPGTEFAKLAGRGRLNLPPEKTVLSMFTRAREVLALNGYAHYEISNYAAPGFACRHNINYWENGSYIGLGAGAVSCFSGVRIKSTEAPTQFIERLANSEAPYVEAEFLPLPARFRETVIMGLRMAEGVSVNRLKEQFGMSPREYYGDSLKQLMHQGLLAAKGSRLRFTPKGMVLANRVMAQLV